MIAQNSRFGPTKNSPALQLIDLHGALSSLPNISAGSMPRFLLFGSVGSQVALLLRRSEGQLWVVRKLLATTEDLAAPGALAPESESAAS
jgi:hypothetical protein